MALNFSGIGISLSVKDQGFSPYMARSINSMKSFSDSFNDAVKNMKPMTTSTKAFVDELEALTQLKVNEIFEKGLNGKMYKKDVDENISALQGVKNSLLELEASFKTGNMTEAQYAEGVVNLTDKVRLATTEGVGFAKVMTLNADGLKEVAQMVTTSKFKYDVLKKSVQDASKDYKEGKGHLGNYVAALYRAAEGVEGFGNKVKVVGQFVKDFAFKAIVGTANGALKLFSFGMSSLFDIFTSVGKVVLSTTYTFVSKFIPTLGNIGSAVVKLKDLLIGLADSFIKVTLEGMNLTTGYEARLVALDKSASHLGANAGLSGGALRKFSGQASAAAIGLNMSAEETGNALVSFNRTAEQFKSIGIKSFQDLAKVSAITGVNAQELSRHLLTLDKSFGITGPAADKFMGSFVSYGKEIGDVGKGLSGMDTILETMGEHAAIVSGGKKLKAEELNKFAVSTVNFSRALYKVTGDAEGAQKAAIELGKDIITSRKDFNNLFAGTAKDVSQFTLSLGIAEGDIGKAFKDMKKGPAEFTAGLVKMYQEVKNNKALSPQEIAQRTNFIRGQLEGVYKGNTATVMKMLENGDDVTLKMLSATDGAKDSLTKLGKEYKTGYTLADRYNLATDRFVKSFRDIGRSEATKFVAGATVEFGKLNKQLADMAADKTSTMGKVITKMSEIHQLGGLALLPQTIRPMAAAFGTLAQAMMPTVQALGSFGISVKDLFSPVGLLIAAVGSLGTWFLSLKVAGKSTAESFNIMADGITGFFKDIPGLIDRGLAWIDSFFDSLDDDISDAVGKVDWGQKWKDMFDAASAAFSKIGDVLSKLATAIWQGLGSGFDPNKQVAKTGLEKIGQKIGQGLRKAWDWVVDFAKKEIFPRIAMFANGLYGALTDAVDPSKSDNGYYSVGATIGGALKGIWHDYIAPAGEFVWKQIKNLFSGFWSSLWGNPIDEASGAAGVAGGVIGGAINSAIDVAWGAVMGVVANNPGYLMILAGMAGLSAGAALGPWGAIIGGLAGVAFGGAFAIYAGGASAEALGNSMADDVLKSLDIASSKMEGQGKAKVSGVIKNIFAEGGNIQAMGDNFQQAMATFDNWSSAMMKDSDKKIAAAKNAGDDFKANKLATDAADTKIYLSNIDKVVSGYSNIYHVSNAKALSDLSEAMNDGTFLAKAASLKYVGALKDIETTSDAMGKKSAQSVKDFASNFVESFNDIKNNGIGVSDTLKTIGSQADEYKNKAAAFLGLGVTKSQPKKAAKEKVKSESKAMELMSKADADKYFSEPVFKKALQDAAKNLDAPVRKTVEEVLGYAFGNAYDKIKKSTKKFTMELISGDGGFTKLVDDIKNKLTTMWDTIVSKMKDGVAAIKSNVLEVSNSLATMIGSMEVVGFGKSITAEYKGGSSSEGPAELPEGTDENTSILYNAIHKPDWYLDYRGTFLSEMMALRTSVNNVNDALKAKGGITGGMNTSGSKTGAKTNKSS